MRAILCLLLGAVTTVGVAWALAIKPVNSKGTLRMVDDGTERVFGVSRSALGVSRRTYHRLDLSASGEMHGPPLYPSGDQVTERTLQARRANPPIHWELSPMDRLVTGDGWGAWPELNRSCAAVAAGYPFLALWGCSSFQSGSEGVDRWGLWVVTRPARREVPLLPIFPGFLLNTLFYAAPWWVILVTPGALKRFRRRRRGRAGGCVHCGYNLAGLKAGASCPECGHSSASAA